MSSQPTAAVRAETPEEEKKARMTIHCARDAQEVDSDLMPYLGLTPTDEKGIEKAVAAGAQEGDFVKLLFASEEAGMSLTYAWFKPHFVLPRHSHNADCAYYVISGEVHMGKDVLKAGDVFYVPRDHAYTYVAGPEGVEVLECRTTAGFHIKFSGNSEAYWSRLAKVSAENRESWAKMVPPIAARRMTEEA